jgi:hypothetical protein
MFTISVQSIQVNRELLKAHQQALGDLWTQLAADSATTPEDLPWVHWAAIHVCADNHWCGPAIIAALPR